MTGIRSLCVLCGSREGTDPIYRQAAVHLGEIMARNQTRLIYGGGAIGLMGVIADAVLAQGGQVTGVIPDFLVRSEVSHPAVVDLRITGSMHDRKRQMFEMADAFCVLPGGLGTLDETFEIITWKQINLHSAPIIVLDLGGYWQPLIAIVESIIAGGFADPSVSRLFTVVSHPEDVIIAAEDALTSDVKASTEKL
ncbi:MAG: TIGR00730 family Rossman fold protein [Hyphomicrobiales bacterium]|nr:TIGR00730 family Rossman fold protein [Hyphomicrobiales bacterium]